MAKVWIDDRHSTPAGKERGGSRWRVGWYEEVGGERKLRGKSFATKTLAEEFRTATEHSLREGSYRPAQYADRTFGSVAAAYMKARHSPKSSTMARDARDLRTWVLPTFEHRKIGSVKSAQIEDWIGALSDGTAPHQYRGRGIERVAKPLSANSIKSHFGLLNRVFAYAVKHDWIARNPATAVRSNLPKPPERPQKFLNFVQVENLANAAFNVAESRADRVLVLLLAYTGMRIGEALSLEVRHVDVKARRILVEQTWTDAYGTLILGTPKNGKSRKVPIDGWLIEELEPFLTGAPDAWVFAAPRGGNLYPNNWRDRVWRKARIGTGFEAKGLTPHDLRHTAASMAIAAGADVKVVQTMLGHASATETLDRYGHLWPDRLDEVTTLVGIARATALATT